MSAISVNSEIGVLKKVLLHRPGAELLNLTPDSLERLLFDDIPYLIDAQKEHDEFAKILKSNGVTVVYLEDLMADVLKENNIKDKFINQFIKESDLKSDEDIKLVYNYLKSFKDEKELVLKTMEGIRLSDIESVKYNDRFLTDPMPNLYFTRDPFVCVGCGVVLNHMSSVTRHRETIFSEYIFNYHKDFKDKVEKYYDRYLPYHIEGGDILNLNENTLAIGISERTEKSAIYELAKNIFKSKECKIKTILAFNIPASRAFMHLDTVFTQIDYDKFTYHPGIIGNMQIFEITSNLDNELNIIEIHSTLEEILEKYIGRKVELIPCAGGDKISSEREQWNDGSNTLCIAPGTVIVYNRNNITNNILREHGIKVLEMPSAELSRGRGGPRCMSMPLVRKDLK